MKKLDFIYFDAGGGHRAAATALKQVIEKQGRGFEIRLVNLQEQFDPIDFVRQFTGVRGQDVYNLILKKGWTLGTAQALPIMHVIIRMFQGRAVRVLREFWLRSGPDLVVSLVPNFGRALWLSLQAALPTVPLVTILTDLADYPPHFWIERQEQYYICGTDRAAGQALSMGHSKDKVLRVSGMILNPHFYDTEPLSEEQRAAGRRRLGLDPAQPVGLLLFGGQGAAVMEGIAQLLPDRQLIAICGHNARLRSVLQSIPRPAAMFVEGFTQQVPRYMQLADYFIGKPGPGSVSEAVAMRLPMIVERNAWTLPQERYNTEWIREQGVGLVLPKFRGIGKAVDQMLDPVNYRRFRAATERIRNRAVFEIPEILERILAGGPA